MHATHQQAMNLRQHYRPQADRLPRWLHRMWAWF
jgi:hypothetical protein